MKRTLTIVVLLGMGWTGEAAAQDTAAAGRTFRARCLSCHQAPDLSLATDRAWLDQVHRTA